MLLVMSINQKKLVRELEMKLFHLRHHLLPKEPTLILSAFHWLLLQVHLLLLLLLLETWMGSLIIWVSQLMEPLTQVSEHRLELLKLTVHQLAVDLVGHYLKKLLLFHTHLHQHIEQAVEEIGEIVMLVLNHPIKEVKEILNTDLNKSFTILIEIVEETLVETEVVTRNVVETEVVTRNAVETEVVTRNAVVIVVATLIVVVTVVVTPIVVDPTMEVIKTVEVQEEEVVIQEVEEAAVVEVVATTKFCPLIVRLSRMKSFPSFVHCDFVFVFAFAIRMIQVACLIPKWCVLILSPSIR